MINLRNYKFIMLNMEGNNGDMLTLVVVVIVWCWPASTHMSNLTKVTEITLTEVVKGTTLVGTLSVGINTKVQVLLVGTASVHHWYEERQKYMLKDMATENQWKSIASVPHETLTHHSESFNFSPCCNVAQHSI